MDNSKAVGWKVKEVKYKHRDVRVSTPESHEEDGLEESELGNMEEDGGEAAVGEEGEEVNGSDDENEDEPCQVIADDEEELDDDILAWEGYGEL